MASDTSTCVVCGEDAPSTASAECNWCDGRFHLNQRNDGEAKDCGRVWIDEQYLALQFACDNCLRGAEQPAAAGGAERAAERGPARRRYRRRA
jgi:hypothetical protein